MLVSDLNVNRLDSLIYICQLALVNLQGEPAIRKLFDAHAVAIEVSTKLRKNLVTSGVIETQNLLLDNCCEIFKDEV